MFNTWIRSMLRFCNGRPGKRRDDGRTPMEGVRRVVLVGQAVRLVRWLWEAFTHHHW
jgi:hypothetical protein